MTQAPPAAISVITKHNAEVISRHAPAAAPLSPDQMASILSFGIKDRLDISLTYQINTPDGDTPESITFDVEEAKSATLTAWFNNLQKGEVFFTGWEGQHITKQLMANRLALYDALGCREISSAFVNIGAYAFARYGFIPDLSPWQILREKLQTALPALSQKFNLSAETIRKLEIIAANNDPRTIWQLVDMPDEVGGKKLAFVIIHDELQGQWGGVFDLNNSEQIARARTYIRADIFDASRENARRVTGHDGRKPAQTMPALPLLSPE